MFDIPNAKWVRREELHSRSSSPDSPSSIDPDIESKLREHFEKNYLQIENETIDSQVTIEPHKNTDRDGEVDGFEFRLFSKSTLKAVTATNGIPTVSRVTIRSPSPVTGEPGFIHPRRPTSYYFTYALSEEEKLRLQASAVSGQDIFKEARRSWTGNQLPWRVTTLKVTAKISPTKFAETSEHSLPTKRKRDGKKRRIANRKRIALDKAKKAEASMSMQEKEATEKEKHTRKNREKKVKKKMKEKAKKLEKLAGEATWSIDF
ncbi:MAG: hypothetical protein MMC33_004180 [Icmadophila ericetorum]|nr:hypothetical protein [Icmadophila ericetorum]